MKRTIKKKSARRWFRRNAWRLCERIAQGAKFNKGDRKQIDICNRSLDMKGGS